jgi:hypothetical protein
MDASAFEPQLRGDDPSINCASGSDNSTAPINALRCPYREVGQRVGA